MNQAQLARFDAARRRLPRPRPASPTPQASSSGRTSTSTSPAPAPPSTASPRSGAANPMQPVVRLLGRIVQTRDPGRRAGRLRRHPDRGRPSRIATVSVGYADGYRRSLSGRATALAGDTEIPSSASSRWTASPSTSPTRRTPPKAASSELVGSRHRSTPSPQRAAPSDTKSSLARGRAVLGPTRTPGSKGSRHEDRHPGSGVIGTTSAWYLAAAGEVTVLDRQPGPALETSSPTPARSRPATPRLGRPGIPVKAIKVDVHEAQPAVPAPEPRSGVLALRHRHAQELQRRLLRGEQRAAWSRSPGTAATC